MNEIFDTTSSKPFELTPDEKKLFSGIDQLSEKPGRIYKRLTEKGGYEFFQPIGAGSEFYHTLLSQKLSEDDIKMLDQEVIAWLKGDHERASKIRVAATFLRILWQVQIHSYLTLNQDDFLLDEHLNAFNTIYQKVSVLAKAPSDLKDGLVHKDEIDFLRELSHTSKVITHLPEKVIASLHQLENPTHPVVQALQALSALDVNEDLNPNVLKEKVGRSQLNQDEVEKILESKNHLIALKKRWSHFIDIESFRFAYKGLDQLLELTRIADTLTQHSLSRQILENLIEKSGRFFLILPEDLKQDFGLASLALTRNTTDLVIVKEVIRRFGELLVLASLEAKDDPQIVELAVQNNPRAFEFASKRIQNTDLNIARLAIQQRSARADLIKFILRHNGAAFPFISEEYKQDSEFVSTVLRQNHLVALYLPDEMKKHYFLEKLNSLSMGDIRTDHATLQELEIILDQCVNHPAWIQDDKLVNTLWSVSETVIENYLNGGHGERALFWCVKIAETFSPATSLSETG